MSQSPTSVSSRSSQIVGFTTSKEKFQVETLRLNNSWNFNGDTEVLSPPPKRGKSNSYSFIKSFGNLKLAKKYIEICKYPWKYVNTQGDSSYYKCRLCPMKLKLVTNVCSRDIGMFITDGDHDSDVHAIKTCRGLKVEVAEAIENFYDAGYIKTNNICSMLRTINLEVPKKLKLYNFLARLKKRKLGPNSISLSDMRDWCTADKKIPENIDQVFVSNHELVMTDDDQVKNLV